ncbi:MAG: dienelactone hydrolase family protein [Myxococcota bacterium]
MQITLATLLAPMCLALGLAPGSSHAAPPRIATRDVTWTSDGIAYAGQLVWDPAKLKAAHGHLPGVMVIHQWMGPSDNERMRARMLAELGYAAFVADVYGVEARPKSQADAGPAAMKLKGDRPELRKRLRVNLDKMLSQPEVDGAKVAAIGYCFGGTAALELARSGAALAAVVTFHGGLDSPTPADGANIHAKVLVLHGAADPYVKAPDIQAFLAELDAAKVDWQMVSYAGAVHAFTQKEAGDDPSKGAAYNEAADRRSWVAMKDFLAEALR